MSISIGETAPDFTLKNQHGEQVSLADFRGKKNILLMFYPFAFTSTCTGELCAIRDERVNFLNDETEVISVSCDSHFTLKKFAESEDLTHNLLSDFWPHGEVAQAYGVFMPDYGLASRGTFLIDKEGVVRWMVLNGPGEARSTDDYRAALAELSV